MKKRFIAVSLVIAMAMTSLLACSSKNDAETASSDTKAKKEETKKEPTKVILNLKHPSTPTTRVPTTTSSTSPS